MSFLDDFRTPEGFGRNLGARPEIRTPRSSESVRTHAEWVSHEVTMTKVASRFYLVRSNLLGVLIGETASYLLRPAISSRSGHFVWPIRVDRESAEEAAQEAATKWCRVIWENSTRAYRVEDVEEDTGEPTWPFDNLEQLLEVAFAGRILDSPEDPVVQKILADAKRRRRRD